MEEKIERIRDILVLLVSYKDPQDYIDEAAAEIAKLVDQQLQSEHEEIRIRTKREVELLAQLAEMRRWIEPIHELCEHYKDKPGLEKEAYAQIYRLAGYALSAAPEVLWAGEGEIEHRMTGSEMDIPRTDFGIGGLSGVGGHHGMDGEQVKVIVTKPINQKQLTIESKAKTVDKDESGEWDSDDLDELPIHDRDDYPYG